MVAPCVAAPGQPGSTSLAQPLSFPFSLFHGWEEEYEVRKKMTIL
jgi:hypothetical protein